MPRVWEVLRPDDAKPAIVLRDFVSEGDGQLSVTVGDEVFLPAFVEMAFEEGM